MMTNSVRDLVKVNGFKRPAPTLSVTALVRDVFNRNPDKRYSADEVHSIVASLDPGIEKKAVGSLLSRLTGVKGNFFLSVENPNTRTTFYKLARKSGTTQDAPSFILKVQRTDISEIAATLAAAKLHARTRKSEILESIKKIREEQQAKLAALETELNLIEVELST